MNTVLTRVHHNALLVVMRKTLQEGLKALKGLVVMSPNSAVTNSIADNQVRWRGRPRRTERLAAGFLGPGPLERIKFINKGLGRTPPVYWIRADNPQAFLTGRCNPRGRAISHRLCAVELQRPRHHDVHQHDRPPSDGCYITGFFLEGARWDYDAHLLTESVPRSCTATSAMWLER